MFIIFFPLKVFKQVSSIIWFAFRQIPSWEGGGNIKEKHTKGNKVTTFVIRKCMIRLWHFSLEWLHFTNLFLQVSWNPYFARHFPTANMVIVPWPISKLNELSWAFRETAATPGSLFFFTALATSRILLHHNVPRFQGHWKAQRHQNTSSTQSVVLKE